MTDQAKDESSLCISASIEASWIAMEAASAARDIGIAESCTTAVHARGAVDSLDKIIGRAKAAKDAMQAVIARRDRARAA